MKTVEQQIQLMKLHWPQFTVSHRSDHAVRWVGELQGIEMSYLVAIAHSDFFVGIDVSWQFPRVRVLHPRLRPNLRAAEEAPLPHVYFSEEDITLSPLCLFDPEQSEWSHDDFIALTTVYWAADWFACYEGWLATGRWYGGGRHQSEPLREAS